MRVARRLMRCGVSDFVAARSVVATRQVRFSIIIANQRLRIIALETSSLRVSPLLPYAPSLIARSGMTAYP